MTTEAKKSKEEKEAEYKARAEADFDPVETAQQRLERLKRETAEALKEARAEARKERAEEANREFNERIGPAITRFVDELKAIEEATGKVFRQFGFRYLFPANSEADAWSDELIDIKSRLVAPRGESTE